MMKRMIIGILAIFSCASLAVSETENEKKKHQWLEVEIGIIGTASDDILKNALIDVENSGYAGLIISLDTPGGVLEATRSMVKSMMSAPFPVIVWVGPSGARAGSAGAFITLAAHVAAMAPGTNIGAAHPIEASGRDISGGEQLKKKVESDTIAFMESIAENRGRNRDMAVSFVENSISISATEALEHAVIDLIAANPRALLQSIHEREVKLNAQTVVTLDTRDAEVVKYVKTLRQRFLEILSNPNLFYLLFIAGLIGIGFELTHPGSLFPGVVGGIALILALIATSVLPVNFGAMLLMLAAIAFIIAEVFLPSFGILGIGGFIAFVIGSVLLIDPSNELGLRISWMTIAPGAFAIAAFGILASYLVVRADRSRVKSGAEGMIGARGIAIEDFNNGKGKVRVLGEIWSATVASGEELKKGDAIETLAVNGLELSVRTRENRGSESGGG